MTVMLHRYDFSILLFLFYGNDHLLIMGQRMLAVIFGLNNKVYGIAAFSIFRNGEAYHIGAAPFKVSPASPS